MRQRGGETDGHRAGRDGLPAAGALLSTVLCALFLPAQPVVGQSPANVPTFFSRHREFKIPFSIDPGERRISTVRLYVSSNQGQVWQTVANAQPGGNDRSFTFKAERDGWYWFSVQTVDHEQRAYPPAWTAAPR